MGKRGHSQLGKCAQERGPKARLRNLLLKRLGSGPMDPLKHLSRARNRDGVLQEGSNVVGPHDVYHRPKRFLRTLHQQKHHWLCLKEQRREEMKGGCQTSGILEAGSGLAELCGNKHGLAFRNKEEWLQRQTCGCGGKGQRGRLRARGQQDHPWEPWGRGIKPQKIFGALMEFLCWVWTHLVTLYSFRFPSMEMGMSILYLEGDSCFLSSWVQGWKGILSRAPTQSHTQAWCRWRRGWALGLTGDAGMG